MTSTVSVSYTHLDVYKRQGRSCFLKFVVLFLILGIGSTFRELSINIIEIPTILRGKGADAGERNCLPNFVEFIGVAVNISEFGIVIGNGVVAAGI